MKKIIALLILIIIALGLYYIVRQTKGGIDYTKETPQQLICPPGTNPQGSSCIVNSDQALSWKTYTNPQYGFSFQYPSNWKLSEDKANKEVTVATDDSGGTIEGKSLPSYSIKFKATDKNFFNPPIGTKWGMISYDERRNALTDGDRCLPATTFPGSDRSDLAEVIFGGSNMSDPAYHDSAILTTDHSIVIVHTEQGSKLSDDMIKDIQTIENSFNLLNGNRVYIPQCK